MLVLCKHLRGLSTIRVREQPMLLNAGFQICIIHWSFSICRQVLIPELNSYPHALYLEIQTQAHITWVCKFLN